MNTKFLFLSFMITFSFSGALFGQKNYKTLVYEGNQKFKGKDYEGASSRYMEAIKSDEKEFTAHYNLGNALYKSKKYEEAKAEFEKAQSLSQTIPDKAAALHNLGNSYMQMNQPEKAADFYKQSLKQDPYNEATRKNFEIAKLKEKENQQKKDQKSKSGKGGGGDDQQKNKDKNGDPKQDQGKGQNNEGESPEGDQPNKDKNNQGKMPKDVENAILNKVGEKEKETAKRILNKNSYSLPPSNEKDW
ncbi:tetratricopeptide repeat protein [Chryseobacterium chendengshani]|uniref:tetratricopeptide repeat protein n=1 Tax=unclassified Chryseobacterium TaxID=2593645 RepID=UPI001C63F495|nr:MULTISPECIES: tetratricopeptide repeat protein [unclassified Chryseobacterium]MBW7676467.1 tetratricopeptide repeat protein [Chryseobacterium sp. LJ756]MBW8523957.1 tetratricopeptide repeat protein [Chryseobacterium sp. LJ668]QYK16897.1 tetratricopeptide repeat protein [Chryseobacterium sp. LJ668]